MNSAAETTSAAPTAISPMRCGCSHSEARAPASISPAAIALGHQWPPAGMPRRDQRSIRAMMTLEKSVMQQIEHAGRQEEGEIGLGRAGGGARLLRQFVEADDGEQRRVLGGDQPEIGEAGNGEGQHGGQRDAPQHQAWRHAIGPRRLDLPLRDREDRAADDLGRIGALHDAEHADAGDKAVDVDALVAEQLEQRG